MFNSLATLVATADLVVHADPTAAVPGPEYDDGADGRERSRNRQVTLGILQVMYSKDGTGPKTVVLLEDGWVGRVGSHPQGRPWTEVGRKGIFFLKKTDEPGRYGFVGIQGRILEPTTGPQGGLPLDASGDDGMSLTRTIESMGWSAVQASVASAVREVVQGAVRPQPMGDPQ